MLPLNPFLRAFFSSKLLAQCSDPADHILLVPTTDFIFNHRDRETQLLFSEFVCTEEFLASHVLHVSSDAHFVTQGPAGVNLREGKAKARQYSTLNGRTIIVKDIALFTNKGFKTLTQSQLLSDELYYANGFEQSQWLIYYISKPLLGSPEPSVAFNTLKVSAPLPTGEAADAEASSARVEKKHEIKNFQDILNNFPMIRRQLQSGLEQLFQQFHKDARMNYQNETSSSGHGPENPLVSSQELPPKSPDSRRSSLTLVMSVESGAEGMLSQPERHARRALENLVVSTINLFQRMDQQHLSMLGSSTDLSGIAIEGMLERYVTEQVHEKALFPTICDAHQVEDDELDNCLRHMLDVDIIQIGIGDEIEKQGRDQLIQRVEKAVSIFKKIGTARSPMEMGEILIETESCITSGPDAVKISTSKANATYAEKANSSARLDADMLIPLLLIVVIRSQVRNLQSRLAYMRGFTFFNDVESGELGYVISTFEAVLLYISTDSSSLIRISRTNRSLWQAVKKGNIPAIKSILDSEKPGKPSEDLEIGNDEHRSLPTFQELPNGHKVHVLPVQEPDDGEETTLKHVFPFMAIRNTPEKEKPKLQKRVSMDLSSISSRNSIYSHMSGSSAMRSMRSSIIADITADQLLRSRDYFGNSIIMMAVEHNQLEAVKLFLQWEDLYSAREFVEDRNNEGTTLLSAAIQLGNRAMIDALLEFLLHHVEDTNEVKGYLRQQDSKGRCVAHYLFNAPDLITRLGPLLPWRLKDKNGQTPLFALCRSYDHETYSEMIDSAMKAALKHQGDGQILQLEDHVDGKRNTLLHIAYDPQLVQKLLHKCDSDPNAYNEKKFTPMMLASKFARVDSVRIFYSDERTDIQARDLRGLTAVDLAKDEEVRNRIDDMSLLAKIPLNGDRRTNIARSLFVEDGSIRMVIKSGQRNSESTITVSTSRRSQMDFLNLVKCLLLEEPASWVPSISDFRSPFQIPSRPSRQILRDIQMRLDSFLQNLITHPTFGTHETLWEFVLVPDVDMSMLIDRAHHKVADRIEKLREDFTPLISETSSISLFMNFASDQVLTVHNVSSIVFRCLCQLHTASSDLETAHILAAKQLAATLSFLPSTYTTAVERYASTLAQTEYSPIIQFQYTLQSTLSSSTALLQTFTRPKSLISTLSGAREALQRHTAAASKVSRWGISILDDARARTQAENEAKASAARAEVDLLGRELRYTQQTVAMELASWQDNRAAFLKAQLQTFARRMVVTERERLASMRRALRAMELAKHGAKTNV